MKLYKKITVLLLTLFLYCHLTYGQNITISGTITADGNEPLPGVSVIIKGSSLGTTSGTDGKYSLDVPSKESIIIFSFVGFKTQEVAIGNQQIIDITLVENTSQLSELVVIGSRNQERTKLETAVPVDVIPLAQIQKNLPQLDLAQMLVATAPSFNAVRSQGGDLNSHLDAPQLRGLAPNQTLVLVNGKRRHNAALLLIGTSTGSPSTAVDMHFMPSAGIERVEILRDGAAAQYGSDAIAGVINVVTKKGTNKLSGSFNTGFYLNSGGDAEELTRQGNPDGFGYQLSANYGVDLGRGGYFNVTGLLRQDRATIRPNVSSAPLYDATYLNNERTTTDGLPIITNPELMSALAAGDMALADELRTVEGLMAARGINAEDVTTYAGQPAINLGSMSFNASIPLRSGLEVYGFGDVGFKFTRGFSCFYRRAAQTDRANYFLYPNGFRPQMTSNQSNTAITTGIRGKLGEYTFDVSNTYGSNATRFGMENTINASLGSSSPIEMNLGKHAYFQNTANIDISRFYGGILSGLNIAVGTEMRIENYRIEAGQEESWSVGDEGFFTAPSDDHMLVGPDGMPLEDRNANPILDANGNPIILTNKGDQALVKGFAPNNQCFRGFGPDNERNEFRNVMAAYLDVELDVTDKFLITGAIRGENYIDFGTVLTGKVASRFTIAEGFAIRGSWSKGFRAPSLTGVKLYPYIYFLCRA